ncbi:amidohydrolase family protein [Rhizobium beringeri]
MIAQIGPLAAVGYGNDHLARFGSPDMIAMPGLVNSHHHFGITPLMQGVPFAPLELWLPQFRAMRQVDVRLDTLYSAIEMLESGTTTVQHINSGLAGAPESWMATADATLKAYTDIGMRAGFSFMIRDRNILTYDEDAKALATLPEAVRNWIAPKLDASNIPIADLMTFYRALRESWFDARPDHVRFNLAPANLHWCTDECLQTIFRDGPRNRRAGPYASSGDRAAIKLRPQHIRPQRRPAFEGTPNASGQTSRLGTATG